MEPKMKMAIVAVPASPGSRKIVPKVSFDSRSQCR